MCNAIKYTSIKENCRRIEQDFSSAFAYYTNINRKMSLSAIKYRSYGKG